jgi:hypothetical protein
MCGNLQINSFDGVVSRRIFERLGRLTGIIHGIESFLRLKEKSPAIARD